MESTPLIAQIVVVRWTKASRGGPGAQLRARIPSGFRIPEGVTAPFAQQILCDERNDFRPEIDNHSRLSQALREMGVVLHIEGELIKLAAKPQDRPKAPPARRLRKGEWIRWKDSSEGHRFSRTITLNLAAISRPPSNIFLGSPTFEATSRRTL